MYVKTPFKDEYIDDYVLIESLRSVVITMDEHLEFNIWYLEGWIATDETLFLKNKGWETYLHIKFPLRIGVRKDEE